MNDTQILALLDQLTEANQRLAVRLTKIEDDFDAHLRSLDIAGRASNAVASGPRPQLVPVIVTPPADTDLTPMDETHSQSAPPDLKSHSAPYLMSPAWGKLPFVIEAALSEGIAWTSISEAIKVLISERKNGESVT
jgi:hypothetical protein